MSVNDIPDRLYRRRLWLLLGIGAFFLLILLGHESLRGSEGRWAEIVREMLLNNNFLYPARNGVVCFDKPLLSYLLIAGPAILCGTLNEFLLRLPNAISGLIVLSGTVYLGRKLFNKTVGLTAGWMMLGSYAFLWFARLAEADMSNLAAIVLALVWFVHFRHHTSFWVYLGFFLICAIGAHLKGIPAWILPPLLALPLTLENRLFLRHIFCLTGNTLSH